MNLNKNYYQILEVTNQSVISDIKKNYKKLALKYHPDKNNGDKVKEEKFKEISEAYSIISDPKKKQEYDMRSPHGRNYSPQHQNPFGGNFGGGGSSIFDDIFGDIFNGKPFNPFQQQEQQFQENLNIQINLVISLRDVYKGTPINIKYKRNIHCPDCLGTGFDRNSHSDECFACNGTGKDQFGQPCKYCHGNGRIYSETCPKCNGEKVISVDVNFNLSAIEDIKNSTTRVLKNYGHQSKYFRNKKGNLLLNIIYKQVKDYKIIDNKLFYNLNLHFDDAIKGAKISYKNLDDSKLDIKIPKKTQDEDIIKIKNKGLIFNGKRNDLYFKINIIIDYDKYQKSL